MHWIALLPLPPAEALQTEAVAPALPGGRAGVGLGVAGAALTAAVREGDRRAGPAAALVGGLTAGLDADLRLWSWRALQFTPRVALADGVVVLEISASERLFGGRRALLRQFLNKISLIPAWNGHKVLLL